MKYYSAAVKLFIMSICLWEQIASAQNTSFGSKLDQEHEPRELGKVNWHYPTPAIEITNNGKEDCHIGGFDVRLTVKSYDRSSHPIYEIIPVFDTFFVKVTELGWGDGESGYILLHDFEPLRKLFGHEYERQEINGYETDNPFGRPEKLISNRISDHAQKFGFFHDSMVQPVAYEPRALSLKEFTFLKNDSTVNNANRNKSLTLFQNPWLSEIKDKESYGEAKLMDNGAALVTFCGRRSKNPNGEIAQSFEYYAKKLQPIELSEESRFLSRLLAVELEGGLCEEFWLTFGDYGDAFLGGHAGGVGAGVTIDFGGKENEWFFVPFPPITLKPGASSEVALQCITPMSMEFHVDVKPKLVYGAKPADWRKAASSEFSRFRVPQHDGSFLTTKIPRKYKLDYAETRRFVGKMAAQVPGLVDHAKQVVSSGVIWEDTTEPLASRADNARRHAMAVLVLSVLAPDDARLQDGINQFIKGIDSIVTKMPDQSECPKSTWYDWPRNRTPTLVERPLLDFVWPIVCNSRPNIASELSVRAYLKGDNELIASAICFEGVRKEFKERYAERIQQALMKKLKVPSFTTNVGSNSNFKAWGNVDVILAAISGWQDWKFAKYDDTEVLPAAFAWASTQNRSRILRNYVGALVSMDQDLYYDNESVIDILAIMKAVEHRQAVLNSAMRNINDSARSSTLMACLRYWKSLGHETLTIEERAAIRNLTGFRSRSEVRDAASELVKSWNEPTR